MKESFDVQAATDALKSALSSNDELIAKFADANKKVEEAFTSAGGALGGNLGAIAGNLWVEGSGESFEHKVKTETENFLAYKVNEIINEMQSFSESANQTYGNNN